MLQAGVREWRKIASGNLFWITKSDLGFCASKSFTSRGKANSALNPNTAQQDGRKCAVYHTVAATKGDRSAGGVCVSGLT